MAASEAYKSPRSPSATLIMRAWRETGSEQPFRARFAAVHPEGHTTDVGIAASLDEALIIVSHWIEEFLSPDPPTRFL